MPKMISKTQISKRTLKKRNPELIETINLARKNNLLELAKKLSGPKSQYLNINLDQLNNIKEDKIMIIGKVLGSGEVNRKIKISALAFSEQAREKLKGADCNISKIKDIIKSKKINEFKIIG